MAKKGIPPPKNLPAIHPGNLLEKAITSGASVEIMERLMDLQERFDRNQARKAYDAAMAGLRVDLPIIVKNKEVGFEGRSGGRTTYRYEDLGTMTEQLSPVMAKHGLSFRWRTDSGTTDEVSVTCIVSHVEGHSEETTLRAKLDHSGAKNPIQALGSAVTYLQRYTIKAALGIAAANDDDGRSVSQPGSKAAPQDKQKQPPKQEPKKQQEYKTTKAHEELRGLIDGYVKERKLTPEHRGMILTRLTIFVNEGTGSEVPNTGKAELHLISEEEAINAIKRFHDALTKDKKAKAEKTKKP